MTLYSRFQKKDPVYFHFECLRVGFYSIFDSLNVGIYVSVVGTTFKTLILETNPFLVRTNGFTADLAFVGNRETEAKRYEAINIVSPLTAFCWLNFSQKIN